MDRVKDGVLVHRVTLVYTTADDGVHLWCDGCSIRAFDVNLGFQPTPAEALAVASAHEAVENRRIANREL